MRLVFAGASRWQLRGLCGPFGAAAEGRPFVDRKRGGGVSTLQSGTWPCGATGLVAPVQGAGFGARSGNYRGTIAKPRPCHRGAGRSEESPTLSRRPVEAPGKVARLAVRGDVEVSGWARSVRPQKAARERWPLADGTRMGPRKGVIRDGSALAGRTPAEAPERSLRQPWHPGKSGLDPLLARFGAVRPSPSPWP
jgi:hypothetical protein